MNQADLATKHFRSAAELEPASPNAHLWLGIALHAGKELPESLKSLIKANDLSKGEMAEVHSQLARVYKDMNQIAKSADELELFLKFNAGVKNVSEIRGAIESLERRNSMPRPAEYFIVRNLRDKLPAFVIIFLNR